VFIPYATTILGIGTIVGRTYNLNQETYAATLSGNISLLKQTVAGDLKGSYFTAIEISLFNLLGTDLRTYNKATGSSFAGLT
jgi:hypothetical protein